MPLVAGVSTSLAPKACQPVRLRVVAVVIVDCLRKKACFYAYDTTFEYVK